MEHRLKFNLEVHLLFVCLAGPANGSALIQTMADHRSFLAFVDDSSLLPLIYRSRHTTFCCETDAGKDTRKSETGEELH